MLNYQPFNFRLNANTVKLNAKEALGIMNTIPGVKWATRTAVAVWRSW